MLSNNSIKSNSQPILTNNNIQISSNHTQPTQSLLNILLCKVCNHKPQNAHLCPKCSKFFCQNCLKTWIRINRNCPNCITSLNEHQFIQCRNLCEQLIGKIQELQAHQSTTKSTNKKCQQHQETTMSYYCRDCNKSVCSDCLIFSDIHRNHTMQKLEEAKLKFHQQINNLLRNISNRKIEVNNRRDNIYYSRKQKQDNSNNGRLQQLKNYTEKIWEQYQGNYHRQVNKFEQKLNTLKTMIGVGNRSYEHLKNQLLSLSKAQLVISHKGQIQQKIRESFSKIFSENNETVKNIEQKQIMYNSQESIILPKWNYKVFELSNYSKYREQNQIVYSDSFHYGELQWRLKIYTNGIDNSLQNDSSSLITIPSNNNTNSNEIQASPRAISRNIIKKQDYISIYVQLQSGIINNNTYRHRIQIIHPLEQNKIISQKYQSSFEIGQCWGYDNFANISTLYQHGYINYQEDKIRIRLSVCQASYYCLSKNKEEIIRKKESQFQDNAQKIRKLRDIVNKQNKNKINDQNFTNSQNSFTTNYQNIKNTINQEQQLIKLPKQNIEQYFTHSGDLQNKKTLEPSQNLMSKKLNSSNSGNINLASSNQWKQRKQISKQYNQGNNAIIYQDYGNNMNYYSEQYVCNNKEEFDFEQYQIEKYNLCTQQQLQTKRQQNDLQSQQLRKIYKRIRRSQDRNLILH